MALTRFVLAKKAFPMSRRILLAVLALWVGGARACAPSENSIITIGENTYVCVVINWIIKVDMQF